MMQYNCALKFMGSYFPFGDMELYYFVQRHNHHFFCSSQPLSKTNANFLLALSQTQAQAQVTVSNIDGNRSNISIPNPLRFLILKI